MWSAYLFELRQIQAWIFATGKLRDASGASELIDSLCGIDEAGAPRGLAADLLGHAGLAATVFRSTGGVLDIAAQDGAGLRQFRALFRLAVAQRAPGLVFGDSLGEGETPDAARGQARSLASSGGPVRGTSLPLGSPMVRPAPLSGGSPAIVTGWTKGGRCKITGDFADLPTLAKRQFLKAGNRRLADRFLPAGIAQADRPRWPVVFAQREDEDGGGAVFPFGGQDIPRIALIHADGNGMGQLFAEAAKAFGGADSTRMPRLSAALAAATQAAVQAGMTGIAARGADQVVPARPVLLGGDDVSLIMRADLATGFVRRFVAAYEAGATKAVQGFKELKSWPKLTVKVGIVLLGPSHPFARAHELCERLAGEAADPSQSRVAFWRVSGAEIPETVEALRAQGAAAEGVTLWRAAHTMEELGRLETLAELLGHDEIGHSPLRRVAEIAKTSRSEAEVVFKRALSSVRKRAPEECGKLVAALKACGMTGEGIAAGAWCPLLQAHDLAQVMAPRLRETEAA
jgi:hypothetical protein